MLVSRCVHNAQLSRWTRHAWTSRGCRALSTVLNSFSTAWQGVDESRDDASLIRTPDPVAYLHGFDAVPVVSLYKAAILKACDLRIGDAILDVGCGTATEIPQYSRKVGLKGRVEGIDVSRDMIQHAKEAHESLSNASFHIGDVYTLPFPSKSFEVVKEDRVLQHLTRPLEAVQEMLRVAKVGGKVVIANPDFRSFQIDTISQRWGEKRTPPPHLDFHLQRLTTKLLNGVIPTLCMHSAIGLQGPRLLRAAGLSDIAIEIVALPLVNRSDLEAIVPISYMARLSMQNGQISPDEMNLWLERLDWEGDIFGVLNMYVCRGIKPESSREQEIFGVKAFEGKDPPNPKHDVMVRVATKKDPPELVQRAMDLINNEYGLSDTGTTLSSTRVRPEDISYMVEHEQLMLAEDEDTGELMGCIQVKIKENSGSDGLPGFGQQENEEAKVGEFTCLAVKSNTITAVSNANTQAVVVESGPSSQANRRGRGIGGALVRAAEARCRQEGCRRMQLGIMCPAEGPEPEYKQWLQTYYQSLGYTYQSTLTLDFETDDEGNVIVDQLHDMYEPLHQLVQCNAILYDKVL